MTAPILKKCPVYALPRPDRLYRQFRFRQRLTVINTEQLEDIITAYGLQVQGRIKTLAGPGRGAHVIFDTSTGKKILKRYKHTVSPETIVHEHSILNYLAHIDFPSPRLTPTLAGETMLQKDDKCYAMFDFLEGYFFYHYYIFLPYQTQQFIAISGKTLGALHNALRHFTPTGYNPNGFKSREGDRWRELSWFTDQLDWCRRKIPNLRADDVAMLHSMFAKNVDWVLDTLYTLDDRLKMAMPSRLIIHGDYGPYNLFFKADTPPVILDFELARLDWRLTDLSKSFSYFAKSRLGFNLKKMKNFLSSYRACTLVDDEELQLIPSVWQFITLRRLIVCWSSYCHSYSNHWFKEAKQKLDLATWISDNYNILSTLYKPD